MSKLTLALIAAGLLAVSAMPAAAAGEKPQVGITKDHAATVDLSAQRRRYYRYGRYYRGGPYYRPYPYYAYGPGYGYGYGYRPYYRPAPFFPFFF
jgi:hypothetical protein